jgi:hypothetical protein
MLSTSISSCEHVNAYKKKQKQREQKRGIYQFSLEAPLVDIQASEALDDRVEAGRRERFEELQPLHSHQIDREIY